MPTDKISRRDQILQQLAKMMEVNGSVSITTASLAKQVKVSEAALYRHFASKKAIFSALIDFIETTLFTRINTIMLENHSATKRIQDMVYVLLLIVENNPGMSKILTREMLIGEDHSLYERINSLFARLDSQIKQIIKESSVKDGLKSALSAADLSKLVLSVPEGLIQQFIRSNFTTKPTGQWHVLWPLLESRLFIKLY